MFNETLFSRHERAFVLSGMIGVLLLLGFGIFAIVSFLF
jgi:flagellar biogenesis protein FliO